MIDEHGKFINGKSNILVHTLRTSVDLESEIISFRKMNETSEVIFNLQDEKTDIENYLSDHFGMKTKFIHEKTGRLLDIPDESGVTIVSTSSLNEVSSWYDNMDQEETRKRFRATIEIAGVPAFWEDHLFAGEGKYIEFKTGDVKMFGMSPRARCVVPSRNPDTGEVFHAFQKSFANHRAASLPQWSALNEYDHYYYLSVDCLIPATEIGKVIQTGDKIKITGERNF